MIIKINIVPYNNIIQEVNNLRIKFNNKRSSI